MKGGTNGHEYYHDGKTNLCEFSKDNTREV